jgi:hypothetical protein
MLSLTSRLSNVSSVGRARSGHVTRDPREARTADRASARGPGPIDTTIRWTDRQEDPREAPDGRQEEVIEPSGDGWTAKKLVRGGIPARLAPAWHAGLQSRILAAVNANRRCREALGRRSDTPRAKRAARRAMPRDERRALRRARRAIPCGEPRALPRDERRATPRDQRPAPAPRWARHPGVVHASWRRGGAAWPTVSV